MSGRTVRLPPNHWPTAGDVEERVAGRQAGCWSAERLACEWAGRKITDKPRYQKEKRKEKQLEDIVSSFPRSLIILGGEKEGRLYVTHNQGHSPKSKSSLAGALLLRLEGLDLTLQASELPEKAFSHSVGTRRRDPPALIDFNHHYFLMVEEKDGLVRQSILLLEPGGC